MAVLLNITQFASRINPPIAYFFNRADFIEWYGREYEKKFPK